MANCPDFKNESGCWVLTYSKSGKIHFTLSGKRWNAMQGRSSSKYQIARPSYVGCRIEFSDFQDFAEWSQHQVGACNADWQIDKDLLVRNNKVYSKDTCVFLPRELNMLLVKKRERKNGLPLGVYLHTQNDNYIAQMNVDGKNVHIGVFTLIEDAYNAYKEAKEGYIRKMAEQWKDSIDIRAYNALINYEVLDRNKEVV